MAQNYYSSQEAAEVLGVSGDELKQLQQGREIYGYRDGAEWKFKVQEIDKLADERAARLRATSEDDESDVLLSEVELGQSDPGSSGTVIGMEGDQKAAADSDIKLGDDSEPVAAAGQDQLDSKVSEFEQLDVTLEEDLTLEEQVAPTPAAEASGGDSDIDLSGEPLDDDDLVLGGSGAGSDVTIGGDSGISLVDPADSGLSLEEPLDLTGGEGESLELGEDDMIALGDDAEGPTELKTDDDFLLTPLEEVGDEEESESGSQVIALDTEGQGDEAATMIAPGAGASSMAAMLEEDLSTEPAEAMGFTPLEGTPGMAPTEGFAEGAPLTQPAAALPEAPYSGWNVASLVLCAVLLMFAGWFMYDLLMNMWHWDRPTEFSSVLMEPILSWFESK